MTAKFFGRPFRSALADDRLEPDMHGKTFALRRVPPGLVHGLCGRLRGSFRPATPRNDMADRRRRVTVKIKYHRRRSPAYADTLRAHIAYLEREGAGLDGRRAVFFDQQRSGLDGCAFASRIQYDERHFRLILAPNDGERIADMVGYARAVMAAAERDLGTRLEWIAAIHEKSDQAHALNRHAHVLLRGIDDRNQALRISPAYIKTGFRDRAQELATERLGPMSRRELAAYRQQAAEQHAARAAERGEWSR